MQIDVKTRADGGSAASQATDLDERSWTARPATSLAIRALVIVIPLLGSVASSYAYRSIVPVPGGVLPTVAWWVGAFTVVVATMRQLERSARRLLPVALMFRMSLVFPDIAPGRFKTALKTGTTRQLQRQLDEMEDGAATATPTEAAQTLLSLVARLSSHDRQTRGHSERVRGYTDLIAKEMELPAEDREKLHWAALIHDVGKLRVPSEILSKDGQPTDEEWKILRAHPAAGEQFVDPLRPWLGEWALATTQHHERYDGKGYPDGLAGDEISLAGRIVAVADAYDVMTSTRSYKKPLPAAQARAELAKNAGTQFDPTVVRAFLAVGLGRTRVLFGPLAWLTELPNLVHVPAAASASVGAAATAAAAAATLAVGSVLAAGGPTEPPAPAAPVERVAAQPPGLALGPIDLATNDDGSSSAPETPASSTTTTTTTTTTILVVTRLPTQTERSSPTTVPPAPSTTTTTTPAPTAAPSPTSPPPTTTAAPPSPPGPSAGPNAVDDHVTVAGSAVHVAVLANDVETGFPLDPLTLTIVVAPLHAENFGVNSDRVRYKAADGFEGSDSLTYQICDTGGGCSTAVLHIVVAR